MIWATDFSKALRIRAENRRKKAEEQKEYEPVVATTTSTTNTIEIEIVRKEPTIESNSENIED